jgi:hypothetical protein
MMTVKFAQGPLFGQASTETNGTEGGALSVGSAEAVLLSVAFNGTRVATAGGGDGEAGAAGDGDRLKRPVGIEVGDEVRRISTTDARSTWPQSNTWRLIKSCC